MKTSGVGVKQVVKRLRNFRGLNNVLDPMRGSTASDQSRVMWEWQTVADNIDITNIGVPVLRPGYTLSIAGSGITSSFNTFNYQRAYIIDSGAVKRVNDDGTTTTLYGLVSGEASWSEINDVVYLSAGSTKLEIAPDNRVRRWGVPTPVQPTISAASGSLYPGYYQAVLTCVDSQGREGGACPSVGVQVTDGAFTVNNIVVPSGYTVRLYVTDKDGTVFYQAAELVADGSFTCATLARGPELTTQFLDEPPEEGTIVAFMGANAYLAEPIPEINVTVVWFSQSLGYHLFNLNSDYFAVPGIVRQMFGTSNGLIIGTDDRIFVYNDDKLLVLADYGVVPGPHASRISTGDESTVYLWSKRGLCAFPPFKNLTEDHYYPTPGIYAGGGVVNKDGYNRYIAVIQTGGDAFNARS